MFEKFKNLFGKTHEDAEAQQSLTPAENTEADKAAMSVEALKQVAKFAKEKKLTFAERPGGRGYTLDGQIQGKPFKIERGSSSRQYIEGVELRARCDLGVSPNAVLMIANRYLKKSLDENAYSAFTDTMETMVNTNMPEEVLWMTMYGEVGWHDLSERFVSDYCILAEDKNIARALVDSKFEKLLTSWPEHRITNPLVVMLMRGRVYLRMQFDDDNFTLDHAIDCLHSFCNQVLAKQALLAAQDE
jgi:hypothetical protein